MKHEADLMQDPSLRENYKTTANLSDRISLHQRFGTNDIGWHDWVLSKLPVLEGQRVVEFGCGRGDLWRAYPDTFDLLLTDRSPAMLDAARQRLGSAQRVSFRTVDMDAIDLEGDSADLVIANHCLYHTADPVKTLGAIRIVLREGGCAVFATNGRRHMAEMDALLGEKTARVDARFGLETGFELTRKVFADVETVRFPDSLHVTDVGPLMDYIRSVPGFYSEATLARVRAHVEDEIARFGAFFVGKDAGLILAC